MYASKFEYYHCEKKIVIGVNLSLYIDSADLNHLGIKIENSDKK
jgi:hypothetical protein